MLVLDNHWLVLPVFQAGLAMQRDKLLHNELVDFYMREIREEDETVGRFFHPETSDLHL
jgi:hypothetical protein